MITKAIKSTLTLWPNVGQIKPLTRSQGGPVIIERFVKSRLTSSKLLNPHQSAYCKHHSTETARWLSLQLS